MLKKISKTLKVVVGASANSSYSSYSGAMIYKACSIAVEMWELLLRMLLINNAALTDNRLVVQLAADSQRRNCPIAYHKVVELSLHIIVTPCQLSAAA